MITRIVQRLVPALLLAALVFTSLMPLSTGAVRAQSNCGNAPPPRLVAGQNGQVLFTDGLPLNVRGAPGLSAAQVAQIPEGALFSVIEGPVCADNIYWWRIEAATAAGWIAEGVEGEYFVEPVSAQAVPTAAPPPVGSTGAVAGWDWAAFLAATNKGYIVDPFTITPPAAYAGNMPGLPVNLDTVLFVADAQLSANQLALLAQNGFVVVPAGFDQFDEAYREDEFWSMIPADYDYMDNSFPPKSIGHSYFITTDAMLHALHYIFDNLLTDLELSVFYPAIAHNIVPPALLAANAQSQELAGTPLASAAYNAELYLAVALLLLDPGLYTATYLPVAAPGIDEQAQAIAALALAGSGQFELSFIPGYLEDFSQYRPRGHYEGDPVLENYFRGMMWLSRITFRANSDAETQIALLLLRALRRAEGTLPAWQDLHDTMTFLVGPVDDLGPPEYGPLADVIFGPDLPAEALSDPARLADFRARVSALPGPRINGLILANDTTADQVAEESRGFRFLGQRFTFDGYILQQAMYPYVGTRDNPRLLPLSLDLPAAMGSDPAYQLAAEAGATTFANYDIQVQALRGELGALSEANWLESVSGTWVWALEPLWVRDPAAYPPLMQTDAWLRRDLQTGLASWTELKHDTVLYAKQPTGFGGGGPPLSSFGYIEPNPLVFARIAVVAALTYQGISSSNLDSSSMEMGYEPSIYARLDPHRQGENGQGLDTTLWELADLARQAARCAEIAQKELAGQPLSEDDYWLILNFGTYLNVLLRTLYQGEGEPDPVALVTDVASNPSANSVLQEGVGGVDYIYVVVPAPSGGYQLVRGGVFSYYEFVGDINQRMTDSEWRDLVRSGNTPPRPAWVSAFFSE